MGVQDPDPSYRSNPHNNMNDSFLAIRPYEPRFFGVSHRTKLISEIYKNYMQVIGMAVKEIFLKYHIMSKIFKIFGK